MAPSVSIVIPVFNKLELTRTCLEMLKQTARHCEILVIDNASTDETSDFLRDQDWVRVVSNAENLGFAKACNQGARLATGEILVLLNNDTEPQPGWLEPLLEELEDPDVAIVGSKLLYPDGTVQHAGVILTSDWRYPFAANHLYKGAPGDAPFVNEARDFQVVTAACMAMSRELFLKFGGFDEGFVNGFEDVDFCLRVGSAGGRVRYAPRSVVIHHESKSPGRHEHEETNLVRLMNTWGGKVRFDFMDYLLRDGLQLVLAEDQLVYQDRSGRYRIPVVGNLPLPLPAEMVLEDWVGYYIPDVSRQLRFRVKAKPAVMGESAKNHPYRAPAGHDYLVSIIIPCWNRVEFTRRCLEALADSIDERVSYEVVLVDNGSTDETPELFASLGGDVQIVTNPSNLGFARACNQGAAAARGKWLLFLNNDTEPKAGWLEAMLDLANREPDVGVVGAKLLYPDGSIQHAGVAFAAKGGPMYYKATEDVVAKEHIPQNWPYHLYRGLPATAPFVNKVRDFQVITGACLLIGRDTFMGVGGFDEAYLNSFEDVDLCLKVLKSGCRVVYCPDAEVVHYESVSEGRHDRDIPNGLLLQKKWADFIVGDDECFLQEDAFVPDYSNLPAIVYTWSGYLGLAERSFASGQMVAALELVQKLLEERPGHEQGRILKAVLESRRAPWIGTSEIEGAVLSS